MCRNSLRKIATNEVHITALTACSAPRSRAACSVSVTKTSSSDGAIARAVAGKPAAAQPREQLVVGDRVASTTACTAWPKMVAPRQNGCARSQAERARRSRGLDLDAARVAAG